MIVVSSADEGLTNPKCLGLCAYGKYKSPFESKALSLASQRRSGKVKVKPV